MASSTSRSKATITLDRAKAEQAKTLTGVDSTSAVIDLALDRLIREARTRRDLAAYARTPLTAADLALSDVEVVFDLDDDSVRYEK